MKKLHISRFTTRVLILWCVLLAFVMLALMLSHVVVPQSITLHAITLNGFLASLFMGLRIIILFLVFSTIPMRWPVTLLTFMTLTVGVAALGQFIAVIMAGKILTALLFLIFIASMVSLMYIATLMTSETIMHNAWGEPDNDDNRYLVCWGTSLFATLRRFSLPLLIALIAFTVFLPLTNHVTF